MQLAKSITPKIINGLIKGRYALTIILTAAFLPSFSQDNSPYTRYGIGDIVPHTNITNRGMGGVAAAHRDFLSINFANPATYGLFESISEPNSRKLARGRAILDVGLNFESRTLREPGGGQAFTATNALFSHAQVGMPLSKRFGLSFGLRPISRISYKIGRDERLFDPLTGLPIDSAYTEYNGDGGSYFASGGLGFKVFGDQTEYLSIGMNFGYLFGKKDNRTSRAFINDTVDYYMANYQTKTTFGGLHLNAGIQYRTKLKEHLYLSLGAYGNLGQTYSGRQDRIRETFFIDPSLGNTQLDSVSVVKDIRGDVELPASYTAGFAIERTADKDRAGWLASMDFSTTQWDNYSFYGAKDLVQNNWMLRAGGELRPVAKRNYFSNVTYRAGFYLGKDYVKIGNDLPLYGISFGMGLPMVINRMAPGQATMINVALEYIKRGDNNNLLKENMFRLSLGLGLSDVWFIKRRYD